MSNCLSMPGRENQQVSGAHEGESSNGELVVAGDERELINHGRSEALPVTDEEAEAEQMFLTVVRNLELPCKAFAKLPNLVQSCIDSFFKKVLPLPPCDRCGDPTYVHFRYFNNKEKSSNLQPRYECRNPNSGTCLNIVATKAAAAESDAGAPDETEKERRSAKGKSNNRHGFIMPKDKYRALLALADGRGNLWSITKAHAELRLEKETARRQQADDAAQHLGSALIFTTSANNSAAPPPLSTGNGAYHLDTHSVDAFYPHPHVNSGGAYLYHPDVSSGYHHCNANSIFEPGSCSNAAAAGEGRISFPAALESQPMKATSGYAKEDKMTAPIVRDDDRSNYEYMDMTSSSFCFDGGDYLSADLQLDPMQPFILDAPFISYYPATIAGAHSHPIDPFNPTANISHQEDCDTVTSYEEETEFVNSLFVTDSPDT